jgi:hypothetical protein
VARVQASLDRLEQMFDEMGAAAYRVGYLRDGVFHHIVIEDDEAAPGAAIAEIMMEEASFEIDEADAADLGIDPDLTRR